MTKVWRIGDAAKGVGQFTGTGLATPGADEVVVDVDAPDLSERMPQVHPGPLAAYAGAVDKRLVLAFRLAAAPTEDHVLRLRALAVQGPVPDLGITVNDRHGRYHPHVPRTDRQEIPGVSAIAGWIDLAVPIRAAWLVQGENHIVLTTTSAEPLEPLGAAHPELGWFWGSAIEYAEIALEESGPPPPADALTALAHATQAAPVAQAAASAPEVALTPLPLYVDSGDGLAELADLTVTVTERFASGEARVRIGDRLLVAPLDLEDRDFGQVRVRLEVPEVDGPVPASVTVVLDGAEHTRELAFTPCRKWTLHLLPHVHLDLGYTDFQAKVAEVHTRNVDRVLGILEREPAYAYSIDGSYVVEQFVRTRSAGAVERLREAVERGRISVNAFYALFLTGLASLEECFRAGRHAAALEREHGIATDYANLTDVPSYSGALPTVLRAMGIDAFLGIQNHGRAATEDSDELHLRSPFQWEGPDGARVLAFFSDCYAQLRYFCGYPVTVTGSAQSFTRLLDRFERDDYLPTDFPIVGIYSDNEDLSDGEAELVARWAKSYAYPRLRFSTVSEYFAAVRPLFDALPVVRGDGGSYWEDGVGAGAAIIAAYREAQVRLASAETLGALASAADPRLAPSLADLDPAWDALLVGCEHTWTSMHAPHRPHSEQTVDQLAWKAHHVATAGRVATDERRRALSQLGELVTTDGPTLLVANPLGWERSAEVVLELPRGSRLVAPGGVVLDGERVGGVDDLDLVRVRVREVPAFGYRTARIEADPAWRWPEPQPVPDPGGSLAGGDGTVESARYRLTLAGGRVVSLRAKRLGERSGGAGLGLELLDAGAPFSLGEVVYVRGGGTEEGLGLGAERNRLTDSNPFLPEPDLEPVPVRMAVAGVTTDPGGVSVVLRGAAPSLPRVEVTIRLRDDDDRVDVRVELDKEAVRAKEGVYVAFPFAVAEPVLRYDRQVGWVDPATDHVPGACNEWFTTQYGVGLEGPDHALTWTSLDAPLFTAGDIVRGRWPTTFAPRNGTILSWIMNNYWWTNFPPSQEGPLTVRYAFRPDAAWDPAAAARFGREARTPIEANVVGWMDKMDAEPRPLPAGGRGLLDVEAPGHIVPTVVAARRTPGLVVRLQETAGRPATVRLRHPLPLAAPSASPGAAPSASPGAAMLVSALEDELAALEPDAGGRLTVDVPAHGIVSVRLGWAS